MTVRCIDIETTGTNPQRDAIVEIASVDLRADCTISNRHSALVAPGIPMPAEASATHHLIDSDLVGAKPIEQAVEPFKGADAYVAHNCAFERSFLERFFDDVLWVCTYKCALRLWPDLASHSNQALRYHLGLINPFGIDRVALAPHRAASDAIVTAAIFFEIARHAKWPDLVQWSYEPALMTYVRFGMHRGERFDAVPADYLLWIVEGNHDLSEDVRFSARYWLERRA